MGGNSSRALNAVTTAITAALGGQTDLQVVTNTLAPYAAQVIGGQFGHGEDKNTAAQLVSHAILGATLAYINGGDPTAGGSAAVASEAAANYLTKQLEEKYKDDPKYFVNGEFQANLLSEAEKAQIRDLTAGIGAVIGGAVSDSTYNAQLAGVIGQNAVENNVLSPEEYKRKVEIINKAQGGTNGLNFKALAILNNGSLNEKEAREFLALVAMDKYSDQLLKQYVKNPKSLSNEQLYDLTYLLNQASNGDPKKAQQIYSDAKFNIGTADPYTGKQLNQAIIKAKQSLSYANSTDKQLAEAAEPALFGLSGKLGTALRYVGGLAGSYNVGQGSEKIANGKYTEGAVQVVNGVLMIAPMSIKNPSAATKNILSNQPFNKSDIVVPKNEINIENINNGINSGKNVYVTLKVDGNLFFDTNQSLRPITKSDLNSPTLISDRINKKLENNPNKLLPNANMASAHGEIGAMQQLANVGKAKNANIIIDVKGKDVCGFCRGDIAAMAEKSGANSVLIHANRDKTGAPVTYYWKPGMKSVKEVKK